MRKTEFKKFLLRWNKTENHRQMPWKHVTDPYKVWLSEIILQQTRVEQGLAYFQKFIKHFPTVFDLAKAPLQKVYRLWEGLGYYSRCRNLHVTAKFIVTSLDGNFPQTYKGLLALKGVGPYTAAAIASFCFNQPYPVIDGNVNRVLARIFKIELPLDTVEGKKYMEQLAIELLDKKNPGIYNQAIMDFGATICKPARPLCDTCIFKKHCLAYQEGNVFDYPVKRKTAIKKERWFTWFVFQYKGKIFIRVRLKHDIWKNLFEFYVWETKSPQKWTTQKVATFLSKEWGIHEKYTIQIGNGQKQQLTHQNIHAVFIEIKLSQIPLLPSFKQGRWVEKKKWGEFAFPVMIRKFLKNQ